VRKLVGAGKKHLAKSWMLSLQQRPTSTTWIKVSPLLGHKSRKYHAAGNTQPWQSASTIVNFINRQSLRRWAGLIQESGGAQRRAHGQFNLTPSSTNVTGCKSMANNSFKTNDFAAA